MVVAPGLHDERMTAGFHPAVVAILRAKPAWEGTTLTIVGIVVALGVRYAVVRIASRRWRARPTQ
jgi:hypothetical protein